MRRLALAPCLAAALAACGDAPPPQRTSVLLVTLDTTRPDALGAWGGPAGATPTLDALARESVVYDAAFTVAPLTQPAHASMLTGLWPPRHGVRMNGTTTLPAEARTLAELAREAGWQTGAFVGALVLDPAFGLDQGFERYEAPARGFGSGSTHIEDRPAAEVVDGALAWLGARDRSRPFLAWVHLFDPHGPYEPPERFRLGRAPRTLYQGELAYLDRELARLFHPLLDGPDAPLVLVVADHGEAFGEHGEETHGIFCYDTTLRVPLLVRRPDRARAGERSDEVVSVVDVYATLADAMGLAAPASDGVSLLAGRVPEGRGVYFESYQGYLAYGTSPLAGWLDARGKYLHSAAPELFDWRNDPGEEHDLARARADALGGYRAALARVAAAPALAAAPSAGTAELADALRGLGYAAAGGEARALPAPLEATGARPSPAAEREAIADTLRGQELANQGRYEEAEAALRDALARMPENVSAQDHLATVLMRRGALEEALGLLRRVTRDGPGWAGSWFNLGSVLRELERPEEALDPLRRAVLAKPTEALFRSALADTLRALGREEEARAVEREADAPR